jgi:ribulose-5-phosphate 4-epimerase/fuculose-1-phosphate aldolase
MERIQIKEQLLEGCQRLASKGFLNTPADSFSLRIPGQMEMILVSGSKDWRHIDIADLRTVPFRADDDLSRLHACIYQERGDVGGIAISSPKWVRLLARSGGSLPPIFDEQVRHIGSSGSLNEHVMRRDAVKETFGRGANAALLGGRLLCLGMTRDRVLFNAELYEKCAQVYVIARACDSRISRIPLWVRLIATRRLLKDEERAAASYSNGHIPEGINAY